MGNLPSSAGALPGRCRPAWCVLGCTTSCHNLRYWVRGSFPNARRSSLNCKAHFAAPCHYPHSHAHALAHTHFLPTPLQSICQAILALVSGSATTLLDPPTPPQTHASYPLPPLQSMCQAILALMSDSAPDSPLNCDAGNLLRGGDVRGYNSLARMYTVEYAMTPGARR